MEQVARSREFSPLTSSVGRLFDAVGALCGIRARVSYEGQAAVELEGVAARAHSRASYELQLTDQLQIDPRAALRMIARDLREGVPVANVARGFHDAVAAVTVRACVEVASARGLGTVVLSGGVFQNRLLLESVSDALLAHGLRVLWPAKLPPNDGGISFGQAAIAAAGFGT
jgi:hydrogenase maturation protein HypF